MKSRRPIPITDKKFPLFPKIIATALGVGYLPLMPGTWAAMLAIVLWLPLYLWAGHSLSLIVTIVAIIVVTIVGTWASTESEKYWGKDPVIACVDEVSGQLVALLPLCGGREDAPWWLILVAFALFRLFDIFKPFGIRRLEKLRGGWGMMADDLAAGALGGLLTYLLLCLIKQGI